MRDNGHHLPLLMADDDPDDRLMVEEACEEVQLADAPVAVKPDKQRAEVP